MSKKRYLCIGGSVVSSYDGETHHIHAIHLPRLYKVHPDVCDFLQTEEESRLRNYRDLIWLRPRADGKYTIPEHAICKCGATMLWMVTASNKRIPVDCRYDLVGVKVFDSKTMTSHFATCSLAKEFKKRNPNNVDRY